MKLFLVTELTHESLERDLWGISIAQASPSRAKAQRQCDRLNEEDNKINYTLAEVDVLEDVDSYHLALVQARAAKVKVKEALCTAFLVGCRVLFQAHPQLQSFSWSQYYGCEYGWRSDPADLNTSFVVASHIPTINGIKWDEVDEGCGFDPVTRQYGQLREPSLGARLQEPVTKFLETFDDTDLQDMFGDIVTVTVYRDGRIESDYCDIDE